MEEIPFKGRVSRPRPKLRIFMAALTSLSCKLPQVKHRQLLTINPPSPLGPLLAEQLEQVKVENFSSVTWKSLPSEIALYSSIAFTVPQLESRVDFAKPVLISLREDTFPTNILSFSFTNFVVTLCDQSLRTFFILTWRLVTSFFFFALCALASFSSYFLVRFSLSNF